MNIKKEIQNKNYSRAIEKIIEYYDQENNSLLYKIGGFKVLETSKYQESTQYHSTNDLPEHIEYGYSLFQIIYNSSILIFGTLIIGYITFFLLNSEDDIHTLFLMLTIFYYFYQFLV